MSFDAKGMTGNLEKLGRARSFFSVSTWKDRVFRLEGQRLTYWDPAEPSKILGEISTEGCVVMHPVPSKDKKHFIFHVKTIANSVNEKAEVLEYNATRGAKERKLWADSIQTSANNPNWRSHDHST